MSGKKITVVWVCGAVLLIGATACFAGPGDAPAKTLAPATMTRIGTVE